MGYKITEKERECELLYAKRIRKKLLETCGISYTELMQRSRGNEYVATCRQVIGELLLRYTKLSITDIGKLVNRDHSTITHYKSVIQNWKDIRFREVLDLYDRCDRVANRVAKGIEYGHWNYCPVGR